MSLLEAAPNAMVLVDRAGRILFVNGAGEALFGYRRDELVGRDLACLVPDGDRAGHAGHLERFYAAPSTRPMGSGRELFGRRKDGSVVPVEIGLNPVVTPEGPATLAAVVDVSERRRAETARQTLAAIVESSDDAVVSKTLEGVVTTWNRAAERLLGYTAEEIVGRSILVVVPAARAEEEEELRRRVQRDEHVRHFETRRRRKDGTEIDVSVSLSPIRDAWGRIVGVSSIARDVTEQKARDAELRRSNVALEQFAHVASHDLQEPLRMVANYTELLAERYKGQLDERADKYIFYASDGARRMQQLIADLLTFSRVGSQGRPLAPVDADAVLDRVLRALDHRLSAAGAEVARGERLPWVLADEGQLAQVFQNILANAAKFRSDAPPRIVVSAAREGDGVRFSVADNGIGLDMKYADRIFQMFQRLHPVGAYEGSGIGLAIAKRIVDRHGGELSVASQPGRGATFSFTLRLAAEGGGA